MQFSDGKEQLQSQNTDLAVREGLPPLPSPRNQQSAYELSGQAKGEDVPWPQRVQRLETGSPPNSWDYEEILDILGFGKVQWILLLISGLLTITSMAAQLAVGIIGISSQCDFNMTHSDKGIMMAACVTGLVLSTYIWGYISDVWGRRSVLVYTMFFTNFLQFVTMFVSNIWVFNVLNFLIGISLGGCSGSLYPYVGEFNSNKYRAVAINYSTMFVSVTAIYVPAISWLVLSGNWSWDITNSFAFKPWRLIILLSLLPGLVGTFMLLSFPESPKLLLAQEKHNEALDALNWMAKHNKGSTLEKLLNTTNITLKPEVLADANIVKTGRGCSTLANIWKATVPLFYKPHGINVIMAVTAMFGMLFSSNGMQIWFPEIVNRSSGGTASGESATICKVLDESFERDHVNAMNQTQFTEVACDDTITTKTYVDNMIVGFAFLIGFTIQGAIINPLGRKNVLLASMIVAAVCGLLLHVVTNTTGVLILFCLYILLPGLSMSIMCGALVDLVPTHLKGKTVSMGLTLGRLGVIVASNLIAAMLEPYCNGIFAIITIVIIISGGLVYFLPI